MKYGLLALLFCSTAVHAGSLTLLDAGTSSSLVATSCTGGIYTFSGANTIITFTSSGTLTCTGTFAAQLLAVAGGGSGSGAGGGGGGYCTTVGTPTCGLGSSVTIPSGATTVTIGAGGSPGVAGSSSSPGTNGGNTIVGSIVTATGGGAGGGINAAAINGGSGGGSGPNSTSGTAGGIGSQGNNGGASVGSSSPFPGAGGGGAGSAGSSNIDSTTGGAGGNGATNSISGSSVTYAGGGGGGFDISGGGGAGGAGGTGGGGAGVATGSGAAGTANTGGGGGGGAQAGLGGTGGSGTVVISCLSSACGGAPLGSCAESQAFFVRAATNIAAAGGAGAVATWVNAVDALICGQVTGGTWSLKDVEYFTVAPTLALAEMNLVSSSYTLSPGSSMIFTANAGLTGVANLTGYADTGYTPSSGQMTTTSSLMGVCVLNNRTTLMTSSFLSEVGTQKTGSSFVLDALTGSNTTSASIFANNGSVSQVWNTTAISTTQGGFWSSRTASNAFSDYLNGVLLGTQSGAGSVALTGIGDFFVLGLNNNGTAFSPGGLTDTNGAVILGGGETGAQVIADEALFTTALHTMGLSSNGC